MFRNVSPPIKIAVLYLGISVAWILGSDKVAEWIAGSSQEVLKTVQSIKAIFFISVTSLFLFWITNRYYKTILSSYNRSNELLNRYLALGEASREGIIDHDLVNDKAFINEQMQLYMQAESKSVEHFNLKFRQRIHPDDKQYIIKHFKESIDKGASAWQGDFRYFLMDGKFHDVTQRGSILRNDEGRPVRFISVLQDVTELRNMRTAFYEQQIRHKQLLGQSIIKAQENERNRWAEELHDNIGQLLTVVKLYLDQLSTTSDPSNKLLEKAREMTKRALDDIRHLSASIKPPEFTISTLEQSIKSLVESLSGIRSFEWRLDLEKFNENQLTDEQKLMVYRVVQEQLNNIIKYAEASFIGVRIGINAMQVEIEIQDNGRGFDPASVKKGIGLRNIRSRLQVYSGQLQIDSSPGKGCTIYAEFSLHGISEELSRAELA